MVNKYDADDDVSTRESLLEVTVDRVNDGGDALGEHDGTLVHVMENPTLDIAPASGECHVIEIKRRDGLITGQITGFSTLEGMERFDTPDEEREWLQSPSPGDFFEGTIDRLDNDENRVIEVDSRHVNSILVGRGDPGDEVVVRLNRKSGDDVLGRVISNRSADPRQRELTEAEKKRVQHRYEAADPASNMNELLNGKL